MTSEDIAFALISVLNDQGNQFGSILYITKGKTESIYKNEWCSSLYLKCIIKLLL